MQFVIGVYATQEQAERALIQLREAGYSEDQVALIANVPTGTVPRAEIAGPGAASAIPAAGERAAEIASSRPVPAPPGEQGETQPAEGAPSEEPSTSRAAGETETTVDGAALGAAIGVILGGGLLGPAGIVVGGIAGGGLGAWLSGLGVSEREAQTYEEQLRRGRYLVVVETSSPPAEARLLLQEAGAIHIDVEPM